MIHYHGTPITDDAAALVALAGGHAFVSFANPSALPLVTEVCQSFAIDNGAFSFWKSGVPLDKEGYYKFVDDVRRHPGFDFAVIPDVVNGSEDLNDALLQEWPFSAYVGTPVWHFNESYARLERLMAAYPRVCLGSAGAFAEPGSESWWRKMRQVMTVACDAGGAARVKLHGLRMLRRSIISSIPLSSGDSTMIARNVNIDKAWLGTLRGFAAKPLSKPVRARILRERIEAVQSPARYQHKGLGVF